MRARDEGVVDMIERRLHIDPSSRVCDTYHSQGRSNALDRCLRTRIRRGSRIDRSAATGLRIAGGIGSCIFGLAGGVRSVLAPTVHAVARERGYAASLGLRRICAGA